MIRYIHTILVVIFTLLTIGIARAADDDEMEYIPSILVIESDAELAELEAGGTVIWHRRADMVLCAVPRNLKAGTRARKKSEGHARIPRPRRAVPAMNRAREWFGAERIHSGAGLPRPYTGKGIVVGFCDTGFDPNHIAFLDESGKSRVKRLVYYDEPKGIRLLMDSPDEIAAWESDSPKDWHGTHVANTLAGGYKGNDYYGMAPDADIVGCTARLYDAGLLSACEDIVEYAKSVNKPAVINLSVGSYNGPHDGSSLFCRYMDLLAEDAIVCLSSGNEGEKPGHFRAHFSADYPSHRTRYISNTWMQYDMVGMTDAWSHDSRCVKARLVIFDNNPYDACYVGEYFGADGPFNVVLKMEDIPELADIYTGEVEFAGYVSPVNGRWVTEVAYDIHTTIPYEPAEGRWARYELGLEFAGDDGVVADIYSDQSGSWLRRWDGWGAPLTDMSISDLCTGQNTVSVGMYTFRSQYPSLDGETHTTPTKEGYVHNASSYGILEDGRVLPHTVGPGDIMISACNSAYVTARPDKIPSLQDKTEANGRTYYWVACNGTSMSCPFTAGTIACWLEANPNLTVSDVQSILARTNSHDYPNPDDPRHGLGRLDPYESIKEVISNAGITTPGMVDAGAPSAVIAGGMVEVFNPGGRTLMVQIISANGVVVSTYANVSAAVSSFDISGFQPGIYILKITAPDSPATTIKFAC